MPTPEFTDPRQVAMYDAVNSYEPGSQPDFYLGVAEEIGAQNASTLDAVRAPSLSSSRGGATG